ncbi:nuclear transport factor 2 family protein [Neptunicoccus sediminis]|uniref:nuclear transport factor 2 family protein n=1 Tax=Neptunicoccus sediminis TaxID=1892596 RepID=UPI00084626BF|nr:nuclear transport factor 2 family protein [Neptunicoccus sediminis]
MRALDKDKIVTLANNYAKAWTAHDGAAIAGFYDEDGRASVNGEKPLKGAAAIADMTTALFEMFADLHMMCDDIRISGHNAVVTWTFYGHHAETAKFAKISGWEEWTLTDDLKIASSRRFYDPEDLAEQCGEAAAQMN